MAKREPRAPLPVVSVEGGHAALGRAMGRAQARQIQRVVEATLRTLHEQGTTEAQLREQNAPYVEAAESIFPELMIELREMARAAEVPFDVLFRLNCYEARPPGTPVPPLGVQAGSAGPSHASPRAPGASGSAVDEASAVTGAGRDGAATERLAPEGAPAGGCTSIVSSNARGVVVGHTEDSWPEAIEGLYLLDATVTEPHAAAGAARSRFLALNYAQSLPGCAAAVNEHGLHVLIDALPDPDRRVGAPRHFLSRALLDVPSIEAALELLRSITRGGGWNFLLVQGRRTVNVEATATRIAVTEVEPGGTYAHTNHYCDPELAAAVGTPRPNSLARLTRALELVRPEMSLEEMKQLLADRQGFPDSICRDRTIGAFVADTARGEIEVCWGEPDDAVWTRHRL